MKNAHFVGGEWIDGSGHRPNTNPANTTEVLGEFPTDGPKYLEQAVNAADKAFESWRKVPAPERGRIIYKAAQIARAHKEEIARDLTLEEGKTLSEARGEVEKGICVLEFTAGEGPRLKGDTVPSEMKSTFAYTVRAPLGVVGLITPWNFPWCIPAWKTAPALLAGNTCILKPATLTPRTAVWLVRCYEEAGVPPGAVNLLFGSGASLGNGIVGHSKVKAISFTGSTEIGRELAIAAAHGLKKASCEMGGKNGVIVLDDADLDLAATGIVQGAFGSTGQRCTATSRVIVQKRAAKQLLERLVALTQKIVVGAGVDPASHMGPAVDQSQLDVDLRYIGIGKEEGSLIYGGRRLTDQGRDKGFFVEPTLIAGIEPSDRLAREEVFGPVLSVLEVDSALEAIRVANDTPFGLSSSIYSSDVTQVMRYIDDIEVGIVHINSPTVGGEPQLPFGGTKATGLGTREMGRQGVEFFTEEKTVYIDYTGAKRTVSFY